MHSPIPYAHTGHHAETPSGAVNWELALFDAAVTVALVAAAAGYIAALVASRKRSPWPARRTSLWFVGLGCAGAGVTGPVAAAAHTSFSAHMLAHLLLGMAAPLLLVLAAPLSLALRALPLPAAKWLARLLRSQGVRCLTHPLAAAVLNAGGLWILYTTGLYQLMHASTLLHALVHLHIFLAGYLLAYSLVGTDPNPHRASMPLRSAVLIVFMAAHSILAKWLYAHPPAGVDAADGRTGAQIMYYGGDAVDLVLIILLFAGWYAAVRPRPAPAR